MFLLIELMMGVAVIAATITAVIIISVQKKKQEKLRKQQEEQEFNRTVIMDRVSAAGEEKTAFLWENEGIKGRISLTDMSGNGTVYTKTVDSAILIGKDESSCDVCIRYDRTVSKRHCEIIRHGNEFFIADRGSSNGTYVNDKAVSSNPEGLVNEDVIRLGRTLLKFRILE